MLALRVSAQRRCAQGLSLCQTIPLLQDTTTANVWGLWAVTYRDVVILDAQNRKVGVYNLTEHDLSVEANRNTLKSLLRDAR